ncbi:MAG: glycoside hydrolase family 127 protein [Ktedonobacteraceae bacterium]|nr:glycoside hydrolase family 127 protein [Ktedonobacteraceae bacterium]
MHQDEVAIEATDDVVGKHCTEHKEDEALHRIDILANRVDTKAFCQQAIENHRKAELNKINGAKPERNGQWQSGDHITLFLPMPVHLVESHPHVLNHRGRVAITRGPLVYCLEQADHQGVHVWDIALEVGTTWEARHQPELLGGVTTLHTGGWQLDTTTWKQRLYRPFRQQSTSLGPLEITAIPYYAWANRAPGPMQVWLPIEQ